ncbi:MAG TPA: hypothetical protein DCZ91_06275 [Lachnospiraceae bacterium]|nr:hypothetical protein [Lachnospiraceae bacterium]
MAKINLSKLNKKLASPVVTIALFTAAAAMLLGSTVGGARAALTYYSENYTSRVQMYNIGVSLLENGERMAWRDYGEKADGTWDEAKGYLFSGMLQEGEKFRMGQAYPERLTVKNSGSIEEYVRVFIYKYWLNGDGTKNQELTPDMIGLNLVNLDSDWIIDEEASTEERTVMYYRHVLGVDEESAPFTDALTVDGVLTAKVEQIEEINGKYKTIKTIYKYDGVQFAIEIEADAVQTHNPEDAIWSAWGRRVNIAEDGTLSLK